MKRIFWLALLLLAACQAPPALPTIDILDGDEHIVHATESRIPAEIFAEASIVTTNLDRLLVNGEPADANAPSSQTSMSAVDKTEVAPFGSM